LKLAIFIAVSYKPVRIDAYIHIERCSNVQGLWMQFGQEKLQTAKARFFQEQAFV